MHRLRLLLCVCIASLFAVASLAQQAIPSTIQVQGLRSVGHHGSFKAIAYLPDGNVVALFDQGDGVRLIKTGDDLSSVLAETHIGATGDTGVALSIASNGEIYLGGTSSSASLAGTSGTPYPTAADATLNSFVARFDTNLNLLSLTFLGAGRTELTGIAVTADAVFTAGLTYSSSFPTTPGVIMPSPAADSTGNGFVERFPRDLSSLRYATYLTASEGSTTPTSVAADTADQVFIAGGTSSAHFPTVAALQPTMPGTSSGLLCKLSAGADSLLFSTFIAGGGLTSVALDEARGSLLATGNLSFSYFPLANVQSPIAQTTYQSLLRLSTDGQSLLDSVLLFAGGQSSVTAGPNGTAWITGALAVPLTQQEASTGQGDTIAMYLDSSDTIQGAMRIGGRAINHPAYASIASEAGPPAVNAQGTAVLIPATLTARTDPTFISSQTFDFPLVASSNTLLPSTAADLLPATCPANQSCQGSAGVLTLLSPQSGKAVLGLITGDLPNVTVRNMGEDSATILSLTAAGLTLSSNCPTTLLAHAQCGARVTNSGTGTLTVSASNASSTSQPIAISSSTASQPLAVSTGELDFGLISLADPPIAQTIEITNLSNTEQSFASSALALPSAAPYVLSESATTCSGPPGAHTLAPHSACSITLQLSARSGSFADAEIQTGWQIGSQVIGITGFAQAAFLSVSTPTIDFGEQSSTAPSGLPRFLYLSNASRFAQTHTTISAPPGSPFTVNDDCPSTLEPYSVCQIGLTYRQNAAPALDSLTLTLDQGLTVLVTGETVSGGEQETVLPDSTLLVSPSAIQFSAIPLVSQISAETQIVQITNPGTEALSVSPSVLGPFVLENDCPAMLSPGGLCDVVLRFAPATAGTQEGALQISTGSQTAAITLPISATATPLFTSSNLLDLGQTLVGEPAVLWYQVQSLLPSLAATVAGSSFGVAILADDGDGHGTLPASAFSNSATAPCVRCWIAIQSLSQTPGDHAGTLTLSTDALGNPDVIPLRAITLASTGLLLTPSVQDFGSVPVNSTSASIALTLTHLLPTPVAVSVERITTAGDFQAVSASSPLDCGSAPLQPMTSCRVQLRFTPTSTGTRSGRVTVDTSAGTLTAELSGVGASDPGLAISPASLTFQTTGTQSLTLKNTGSGPVQIGAAASTTSAIKVASQCGTLAPGQTCTAQVSVGASGTGIGGTLLFPVTSVDGFGQQSQTTFAIPVSASTTSRANSFAAFPLEADFGASATGALGPIREVTIVNTSASTLSFAASAPRNFPLAARPACEALAPGETCTLAIAFLPETAGSLDGSVTIAATAQDGTAQGSTTIYLRGYGVGAATLAISNGQRPDAPVSFGQVVSGQNATQTVTVTNTGSGSLKLSEIATTAPFRASSSCPTVLAAGANCPVAVTYTPSYPLSANTSQAPRTDVGTLTIQSDAATSADTVYLSAIALPSTTTGSVSNALPTYTLSASAVALFNSGAAQSLTVANTGTVPVTFSGFAAPDDFNVTTDCAVLQPRAACTLDIVFSPQDPASTALRHGTLNIVSNAANALEFVSLLASSSSASLKLSTQDLQFGAVVVGSVSSLSFTLTNTTSLPVPLGALTATAPFSMSPSDCPGAGGMVAAGQTCSMTVTFTPTAAGIESGTLSISSPELTNPLIVLLRGQGIAGHLQINPSALDFGTVQLNTTATKTILITNTGTADLRQIQINVTGTSAAAFLVSNACPGTLPVGGDCQLQITFDPSQSGAQTAQVAITSSAPNGPVLVPVTGIGSLPPGFALTVNGVSAASISISRGSAAGFPFVVTPQGGYSNPIELTCTAVVAAPNATCLLSSTQMALTSGPSDGTASVATRSRTGSASLGISALWSMLPLTIGAAAARKRGTFFRLAASIGVLVMLASANLGCAGGYGVTGSPYTPPGTYVYRVTAASVTGTPMSSSVVLTVIVQ